MAVFKYIMLNILRLKFEVLLFDCLCLVTSNTSRIKCDRYEHFMYFYLNKYAFHEDKS